jgi:putative oxidoreductase
MSKLVRILSSGEGATTRFADFGLALTRIAFGLGIAVGHGYSKIFHEGGFGPPQMMIDSVKGMGFPAPTLFAWLAALAEFAGGLLLAAGLLTRPVAFALVFNMAVAAFVAHAKDPLFATGKGGSKEFALLYLAGFLVFLFVGGGRYSLDALFRRRSARRSEKPKD